MEKLFGLPTDILVVVLPVICILTVAILSVSALRNKVMFKMAARNFPRRPARTALVLLGLMLAAMLFSASFVTGDTLTHSIRSSGVDSLGEIDIVVMSK